MTERMELWINPEDPRDVALVAIFRQLYPTEENGGVLRFRWLVNARLYNGLPYALANGPDDIATWLKDEKRKRDAAVPDAHLASVG